MSDTGVVITAEDFRKTRSRVVLDYTSRDFAAIRAQLVGLAKGFLPDWETAGEPGDFGTLLLELFAYMGDVMHYYIDRTASEAFLGTAVRRQSVLYIADMLGYRPIGQQAASVTMSLALDLRAPEVANPNDPDPAFTVTLPAGTRFTNGSTSQPIIFELNNDVELVPGAVAVSATATEGISVWNAGIGISKGLPNATFLIPDVGVVYGTVAVTTREGGDVITWTYVSDISSARPTQSAFTTFLDDENRTYITFGDNASGRIPPYGAELFVSYRYGVGAAANELAAQSITTLISPDGVNTWGVTVTNTSSPIGGTDPESVESMRYSVPRTTGRLKSRAITLNDYADLALQVPGVAKATAYGTLYTTVYVRIAPTGGVADATSMGRLCTGVESYLSDKILVGTNVVAEPENVADLWLDAYIRMTVHVQPAYNRTQVRQAVDENVRSLFNFDNVDFGSRVGIGQVYRAALSVQGVEWVELVWLSSDNPGPAGTGVGEVEDTIDTVPGDRTIGDLVPTDLQILRINPTEVTETGNGSGYFPDLSGDELTHDGLWVKAVGGLVNT